MRRNLTLSILIIAFLGLLYLLDSPEPAAVSENRANTDLVVREVPVTPTASDSQTSALSNSAENYPDGEPRCDDYFLVSDFDPETPLAILEASADPEHRAAAFAIHHVTTNTKKVELLDKAIEIDGDNPVLNRMAWQACLKDSNTDFCRGRHRAEAYLATDPENADAWIAVMLARYHAGDTDGAYNALIQAIAAPRNTSYFIERIRMIDRALVASSNWNVAMRFSYGVGHFALDRAGASAVYGVCDKMSKIDQRWLSACLQYGQRLAGDARTLMDASMASIIQSNAYRALGDQERADSIDQTRRNPDDKIEIDLYAQIFLLGNETSVGEFLEIWDQKGEQQAYAFAAELYESITETEKTRFQAALAQCDSQDPLLFE